MPIFCHYSPPPYAIPDAQSIWKFIRTCELIFQNCESSGEKLLLVSCIQFRFSSAFTSYRLSCVNDQPQTQFSECGMNVEWMVLKSVLKSFNEFSDWGNNKMIERSTCVIGHQPQQRKHKSEQRNPEIFYRRRINNEFVIHFRHSALNSDSTRKDNSNSG